MLIRNERKRLSGLYSFCLLAGFVTLVLVRLPIIAEQSGRFWAEEGVVYFLNAWTWPWWQAWFAIHTGYINFIAGFGTWLGLALGGASHAPLVTLLVSLLVQALAPFIILTHDFPWRRSRLACLAAVALCALPPATGEVWLNTITSQFHFALAAALILAAPATEGALLIFDIIVLAVGVLSGPATSFLMPLFVLRALITRRKSDILFAFVIFIGLCVQAGAYVTHPEPARNGHLSAMQLLSVVALHVVVLNFAGVDQAGHLSAYISRLYEQHAFLWPGLAIMLVFYAILAWGVARCGRFTPVLLLLLLAQAVFAFVSFDNALYGDFTGSMSVVGGQRYAFAPMVLTGLILTGCACAASGVRKLVCIAATLLLLAVGSLNFRAGTDLFANGPAWSTQIAAWRKNPRFVVSVWPDHWYMTLPPRH